MSFGSGLEKRSKPKEKSIYLRGNTYEECNPKNILKKIFEQKGLKEN